MKAALLVGWGPIIPGREKAAAQVLDEAMHYLAAAKERGHLGTIDVVLLEPHGGDMQGFVLVRGEQDALTRLRHEPEFLRAIVAVQLVHSKVRVVGAYTGPEMQTLMRVWAEEEDRLL